MSAAKTSTDGCLPASHSIGRIRRALVREIERLAARLCRPVESLWLSRLSITGLRDRRDRLAGELANRSPEETRAAITRLTLDLCWSAAEEEAKSRARYKKPVHELTTSEASDFVAFLEGTVEAHDRQVRALQAAVHERGGVVFWAGEYVIDRAGAVRQVRRVLLRPTSTGLAYDLERPAPIPPGASAAGEVRYDGAAWVALSRFDDVDSYHESDA